MLSDLLQMLRMKEITNTASLHLDVDNHDTMQFSTIPQTASNIKLVPYFCNSRLSLGRRLRLEQKSAGATRSEQVRRVFVKPFLRPGSRKLPCSHAVKEGSFLYCRVKRFTESTLISFQLPSDWSEQFQKRPFSRVFQSFVSLLVILTLTWRGHTEI